MGLIENAKDAAKLVQQIGNLELYEKLVSVQTDAMSLLDENWKLKDEVRTLKEQLAVQKQLLNIGDDLEFVEDGGFYVRKSERAAGKNIPYCPICWKSDKVDIPLHPGAGVGLYSCSVHKSQYQSAAFREYQKQEFES